MRTSLWCCTQAFEETGGVLSTSLEGMLQSSKPMDGLGHGPSWACEAAPISLGLDLSFKGLFVTGSPKGLERRYFLVTQEVGLVPLGFLRWAFLKTMRWGLLWLLKG